MARPDASQDSKRDRHAHASFYTCVYEGYDVSSDPASSTETTTPAGATAVLVIEDGTVFWGEGNRSNWQ